MSEDVKIIYSPEQQQDLDRILQERLAQQKRVHDAELSAVRSEAKARLEQAKGQETADNYLETLHKKETDDGIKRATLGKLFGKGSDGGAANKLARENPALYQSLKRQAEAVGLVGRIRTPVVKGGFRNNET